MIGAGPDARYRCRSEVVGMAIGLVIVRAAQTMVLHRLGVITVSPLCRRGPV